MGQSTRSNRAFQHEPDVSCILGIPQVHGRCPVGRENHRRSSCCGSPARWLEHHFAPPHSSCRGIFVGRIGAPLRSDDRRQRQPVDGHRRYPMKTAIPLPQKHCRGRFSGNSLSGERNDLFRLACRTISSPGFHQLAPLVKQITAPVCSFGFVLDHMRQRGLTNLIAEISTLGRPIAEG
jgi:hypothetical protein